MPESERRHAIRRHLTGAVEVEFEDPLPATVDAELIDISDSGCRISHHTSRQLEPGLELSMRLNGTSLRARVVWTHVDEEGGSVSGCLFL